MTNRAFSAAWPPVQPEAPARPVASRTGDASMPASTRLRELAQRVSRLGCAGRFDLEQAVVEKLTVAAELRALARELEG